MGNVEYAETFNLASGCMNGCPYCYARKIANRFIKAFPNKFKPTFYLDRKFKLPKEPARIFLNSMYDIFGQWEYIAVNSKGEKQGMLSAEKVYYANANLCRNYPQHRFLMLSKLPIPDYAIGNKPNNLWFGFTLTKETKDKITTDGLLKYDYVSCEPFDYKAMANNSIIFRAMKWIIIGCQTNPTILPKKEQVAEIIEMSKIRNEFIQRLYTETIDGIPIFVKKPLSDIFNLNIKEYPEYLTLERSKNESNSKRH